MNNPTLDVNGFYLPALILADDSEMSDFAYESLQCHGLPIRPMPRINMRKGEIK